MYFLKIYFVALSLFCIQLNVKASEPINVADGDTSIYKAGKLIYKDDFDKDISLWFAEMEIPEKSSLLIKEGKLELIAKRGATAWFKQKLSGSFIINYDVVVVNEGGETDRVSDLNLFWMATNPNGGFFNLDGKFPSYDLLHLYYTGIGGNENTTTRFRKYTGKAGDKAVITEYTDSAHLLKGNMNYHIKLICDNGRSLLYVNDVLYVDYQDSDPYLDGYFGFRTTRSHLIFDNFKINEIKKKK